MNSKTHEIDMCNGPMFGKILLFSIPLILSGVLQLLFNAADVIVVGQFAGEQSLAAVGSTSALINLLTNTFIGLSVGTNVLIARYYGAKQDTEISETVHTSVLLSLIGGILLCIIGLLFTRPLLLWMGTPFDVIDKAAIYIKIYFCGMPMTLLFNFGSSILRAIGDTRRPLYYLSVAGILNIILNLIFVICLHMDVAGVALATIIAQTLSAILLIRFLMHIDGSCHLYLQKLKLHSHKLMAILRIGLPAGLQGSIFSLSNVLIQSSVNSFGSIAMAGNTASSNLEGIIYIAMNSFYQTNLSFSSQNFGAGKIKRMNKSLFICLGCVIVTGLAMGLSAAFFSNTLLHIYSNNEKVIAFGSIRLCIIGSTYFLCGIMDTMVGSMRGYGYSLLPMFVSLLGACGFRILWIFTYFHTHHTLPVLYISYPISWFITASAHIICYTIVRKRYLKKLSASKI